MIVTAIMMVRNEQNILPISVGYLLNNVRVDRLIIADNGSTDSTVEILSRLSQIDGRVRWTDVAGPWHPAEVATGLAREAHRDGANWIIVNDADEFFFIEGRKFRDVFVSTNAGALILEVRNFAQWSWVHSDHLHATEKMVFSASPVGDLASARRRVEGGEISFLQIKYPPKLILRGSPSLVVHRGNHDADGVDGDRIRLPEAEVLHAPLRAREHLYARIANGKRVEEVGVSGDTSWHLRRFLQVAQDNNLDDEWRSNSTFFGSIGPPRRKRWLRVDLRLRRIARQQRSFAAKCAPEIAGVNLRSRS